MSSTELDTLVAMAQKSPGWNFREWPPQRAQIGSGCTLIVVPPWLWRSQRGSVQRYRTQPTPMRRSA